MKELLPYLTFLLSLTVFITNERRVRRKEREERLKENQAKIEKGTFPPRKETHRKR
ncbi:hypothetical protein H6F38_23190 [Paenibacillus sp. EKM208P]|nr:hypothetical protein H6F38_23190 [Paenibacillus sp. EKM208P]